MRAFYVVFQDLLEKYNVPFVGTRSNECRQAFDKVRGKVAYVLVTFSDTMYHHYLSCRFNKGPLHILSSLHLFYKHEFLTDQGSLFEQVLRISFRAKTT